MSLGTLYNEGHGVPQDYAEAFRWYRKAADQGNENALAILATHYEEGVGVARDYTEAARLYRKAAEKGHAFSQNNLGTLYYEGREGGPKSCRGSALVPQGRRAG